MTVSAPSKRRIPAKMVGWYDPKQLIGTAQQVAVSSLFGEYSDPRLLETIGTVNGSAFHDHTKDEDGRERDEIWIDYVSDTGDGWDSTYAIAYYASRPRLDVATRDNPERRVPTQSGAILVFGGDEVYPTPSREEYARRLVFPYETARRTTAPPHPHVFAIPGNHDWYDNLISFRRLFMSRDWFAGWQTIQTRSYFALKLPGHWWLIGTDVQLGSDVDKPQVDYFKEVATKMEPQDRIILCNAEPHWIYAHIYREYNSDIYNQSNLNFLENKVFHRTIDVFIAGDLHHYRRHEADENGHKREKITAGGGGAFLHPTHGPDVSELEDGFKLKNSFPDANNSRRLTWRNLGFVWLNKRFGALTAITYLLTAWMVMAPVERLGISKIPHAGWLTLQSLAMKPLSAIWMLLVFGGFWLFTDTHSQRYKVFGGCTHALAHVLSALLIGWGTGYFIASYVGLNGLPSLPITGLLILIGGWIIGSAIMGLYLLISLNGFERHQNEAFSSLGSPDWKNFLRIRIDRDGALTIFPIGLRRVPRKWKWLTSADTVTAIPDDPRATLPELIESEIRL